MIEPPKDSVYSGVVSLRSIHLALLIGKIDGLKTMVVSLRGKKNFFLVVRRITKRPNCTASCSLIPNVQSRITFAAVHFFVQVDFRRS